MRCAVLDLGSNSFHLRVVDRRVGRRVRLDDGGDAAPSQRALRQGPGARGRGAPGRQVEWLRRTFSREDAHPLHERDGMRAGP